MHVSKAYRIHLEYYTTSKPTLNDEELNQNDYDTELLAPITLYIIPSNLSALGNANRTFPSNNLRRRRPGAMHAHRAYC